MLFPGKGLRAFSARKRSLSSMHPRMPFHFPTIIEMSKADRTATGINANLICVDFCTSTSAGCGCDSSSSSCSCCYDSLVADSAEVVSTGVGKRCRYRGVTMLEVQYLGPSDGAQMGDGGVRTCKAV